MDVQVHHDLPGRLAVVLEQVVALGASRLHDRPADPREHSAQGSGGLIAEAIHRAGRFFGDHQRMPDRERSDIEKGEDMLVLVHAVAGDLAAEYLREDRALTETRPGRVSVRAAP